MFTLLTMETNRVNYVAVIPFTNMKGMRVLIHQLAFKRNHPFARPFFTANIPQANNDDLALLHIKADGPVTIGNIANELYVQSLLVSDRQQAYLEATHVVARLIANGSIEVYCDDDDEVTYW